MSERIERRFERLAGERRPGLVTYVMAGDPDGETSLAILKALPGAGADVIELGMPFTDPMADGPAVQAAGLRALKSGQTLRATLAMVMDFRKEDADTPVVLMGYFNPIYSYGVEPFLRDAKAAGVDGLIVVDLPPEEDDELCLPALSAGLAFIRLATPTTDDARLPKVLTNTSGFVYYVSITGVTGFGDAGPGHRRQGGQADQAAYEAPDRRRLRRQGRGERRSDRLCRRRRRRRLRDRRGGERFAHRRQGEFRDGRGGQRPGAHARRRLRECRARSLSAPRRGRRPRPTARRGPPSELSEP